MQLSRCHASAAEASKLLDPSSSRYPSGTVEAGSAVVFSASGSARGAASHCSWGDFGASSAGAPSSSGAVAPEADGGALKILFVEDDPTLRMLTGEVMMELGHDVVASETAEEALEALAREPFDVLLTDVGLAGMSGIDLAREAVTRHPRLSVVIASGYAVNASDVGVERLRTKDHVHEMLHALGHHLLVQRRRIVQDGAALVLPPPKQKLKLPPR